MSLLQLKNGSELGDAKRLTEELTSEFDDTNLNQQYHQPLLSIEESLGRIHLLVIWDAWYPFSQIERSQIIMDAYTSSQGNEAALRVSSAMGLTQDDASQLGVNFVRAPY